MKKTKSAEPQWHDPKSQTLFYSVKWLIKTLCNPYDEPRERPPAGGAEGDAETLRQKDRVRTELWKVNGDAEEATYLYRVRNLSGILYRGTAERSGCVPPCLFVFAPPPH